MDTDYLLNLEEQYYQEGYEEGAQEKAQHNFNEGKQYGLQVGFQRFLLLGQIKGLIEVIEACGPLGTSLSKNIAIVRGLLADLKLDNGDASVAEYDERLVKIRNKLRTILLLLQRQKDSVGKDSLTLEDVARVSMVMAGHLNAFVEKEGSQGDIQDQTQDW